jgi:hypothetical protein
VPFELAGSEPVRDEVELLAFLRAPGRPSFRMRRAGAAPVVTRGSWEIRERVGYQDLLYRGGSSSRTRRVIAPTR